jgi:citrate synthase
MDPWRTAIATSDATNIWIRGHEITSLMRQSTFTDAIVLLHLGRLPSPGERRLLDAILVGVADHGAGAPSCAAARLAASGNRQSLSAAIAAGVLTIGDEHGGAGSNCMDMIAAALELAKREGLAPDESARRVVADAIKTKVRLPGLGHRCHTDPRVATLFEMARSGAGGRRRRVHGRARRKPGRRSSRCREHRRRPCRRAGDMGFPPPAGKFIFIIGRVGADGGSRRRALRERPMRIKFDVTYDGVPPKAE